ncbi:hypothetical protein AB0C01_32595 [Micromonospora sp. NPDC048905]|uniref:hypothetical protein n=1 Tax=unclassified Micromonospora TaxID=2617518 RepID=UPI0033C3AF21
MDTDVWTAGGSYPSGPDLPTLAGWSTTGVSISHDRGTTAAAVAVGRLAVAHGTGER